MPATTNNSPTANGADITALFFSLIQCGIGKRDTLPATPDKEQWKELFELSKKQTLAGIAFAGIEKLPAWQRPQKEILLPWHILSQQIKAKNCELNRKCAAVSHKFRNEGFENCILKGQGIAQLYPTPTLRTPGDIDIWLQGGDKKVISYVKALIPDCAPTYHHVDFPIAPELDIEIHYRPTWMYNPFTDKRLQHHFEACAHDQFKNTAITAEGSFPAPTTAFNRIYILLHIYRHIFFEGIGMRQVLDYYFVMQKEMSKEEKQQLTNDIRRFKLEKFTGALVYAMQQMFAFDAADFPIAPCPKHGKFLMQEIMLAGNFGKYDNRYISKKSTGALLYNNTRRFFTLIRHYPHEALWAPYFKIWHWFWRKSHK